MSGYVIYYRRRDEDAWQVFQHGCTGHPVIFFGEHTALDFAFDSGDPRLQHQFYVGKEGEQAA